MKKIAGIILLVIGLTYQQFGDMGLLPGTNTLGIMLPLIGGFILIFWKD